MKVKDYLADRQGKLLLHLTAAAAMSAFLQLTGTSGGIVVILLIVWTIGLVSVLVADYLKINTYLNTMDTIIEGLDKKYLFFECLPVPPSNFLKKMFQIFRQSAKSMIEAVSDAEAQQKEYREYIESWVHEIKVPITAQQLICKNNESEVSKKILFQAGRIEAHVERALYYARAGSVEKDFIIEAVDLNEIVKKTISKYRTLLIRNGMQIEVEPLPAEVYTDGKWVEFMIGQIVANAVRYRSDNPRIRFHSERLGGQIRLSVTDNGIGIPPHELVRIFERGFTGTNGRKEGGSTGMGLYICKKLSEFLQIELSAESSENEYTSICMTFPAKESLTEM